MREITVEELMQKAESGDKLNVIDVREPDEFAQANIGAKLIPLGKILSMQIDEIEDLKEEELIIHCRSGARSRQACLVLEQLGFTNTVNVAGGILAWQDKYGDAKL